MPSAPQSSAWRREGRTSWTPNQIQVTINGAPRVLDVAPHHTLLEVLRDELALTGTKECCLVGECGACTVIVDGRSVDSCLVLAVEVDGADILTVEGLAARDGRLAPIQQAFLDKGAVQCGFCIPGQLMSAHALLDAHPHPTHDEIEEGMAGNLCRCACYEQIFDAIETVAGDDGPVTTLDSRIGGSPNRVGGIGRVTGAQAYLADLDVAGVLHAKLVTVDCARARIDAVDASAALAMPGVHLVMTADDLPQPVPRFGPQNADRPVLASGETKFHGDPVAIVVADTRDLAEAAAAAVRVDHEELPAVFTVAGALAPDAPLVQDPSLRPGDPRAGTNVLNEHRVGWGDVEAEAARANVIVEGRYTFPDRDPVRDRAARVHGGTRRRRPDWCGARSSIPTGSRR